MVHRPELSQLHAVFRKLLQNRMLASLLPKGWHSLYREFGGPQCGRGAGEAESLGVLPRSLVQLNFAKDHVVCSEHKDDDPYSKYGEDIVISCHIFVALRVTCFVFFLIFTGKVTVCWESRLCKS